MQAMRSAAAGMAAQQTALDVAANNIANISTPGFKRSSPRFTDLLYRAENVPSGSLAVGMGCRLLQVGRDYGEGILENDGNRFHLAVEGEGFFQVRTPDGLVGYTRSGLLGVDGSGRLTMGSGYLLEPPITLPKGMSELEINTDGRVCVVNREGVSVEVGRLLLARFVNPNGLLAKGDGIFLATPSSGPSMTGIPGQGGLGIVRQGYLERSNVDLAEEMVNMIVALRVYEMNAKMIQTADESLGAANNLLRG